MLTTAQMGHGALFDSWYANNITGFIMDSVGALHLIPEESELTSMTCSSFWFPSSHGKQATMPIM